MSGSATARLQVLAAATLFSTGGTAVKACALEGWPLASARSALAAVALALIFPAWRRGWTPRTWLVGVGYASTMILFVIANKLTTAANTIFLQSTAPLYLLLLGPWLLRERISRSEAGMTAVIGLGMALLFVGSEPPQATAPDPWSGNWLGAVSGVTWALTLLGLRALGRGGDAANAVGRAVVAGNLIAALAALGPAMPLPAIHGRDALIVGYLGLFQIGLAYVALTYGVRKLQALETSLLLLLEPVLSTLFAWMIHGERLGRWSFVGCSLILAASLGRTVFGGARRAGPRSSGQTGS